LKFVLPKKDVNIVGSLVVVLPSWHVSSVLHAAINTTVQPITMFFSPLMLHTDVFYLKTKKHIAHGKLMYKKVFSREGNYLPGKHKNSIFYIEFRIFCI
jgi:hypothetical protein